MKPPDEKKLKKEKKKTKPTKKKKGIKSIFKPKNKMHHVSHSSNPIRALTYLNLNYISCRTLSGQKI